MSAFNLMRWAATSTSPIRVEKLPTNITTRNHAVHRWFNFIAGFSPEFVQAAATTGREPTSDFRLLDPFSGCGTAPVAARMLGIQGVAYEPHPFFAAISEAKANSPRYWQSLPAIHAAITRGLLRRKVPSEISASASAFLTKMFREEDLLALLSARRELEEAGFRHNPLAVLILSRVLDHCCFAATDGIYKAPTTSKRTISPKAAVDKVFGLLMEDEADATAGKGLCQIHEQSSESMNELADASVDLVVTSPPYLNNFDFAEMARMYLYFWSMASTWGEITDRVRSRLIVNTTTALKGQRERQAAYRAMLPAGVKAAADAAVEALAQRRNEKAGKKEYNFLVYPYLSQMQTVLRETYRVLSPGAPFHMMVADAALYGVHLHTPQWLAEIMREIGFIDVRYELVRPRGHRWVLTKREGSAAGLGEYYVFGRAG